MNGHLPSPALRLLFCPVSTARQAAQLHERVAARLSPADKAHILRFTAPGPAAARMLARALLVLACLPDCPNLPATLSRTVSGAPRLHFPHADMQAALSFAYSPQAVVCALAFGPPGLLLGVDLEALASPPPAPRAFHPCEQISGPRDALRRWTIKEALLKARGTGLAIDPATISTGRRGRRRGCLPAAQPLPPLLWRTLPLPGHWCSLALSHPLPLRLTSLTPAAVVQELRRHWGRGTPSAGARGGSPPPDPYPSPSALSSGK